MSFNFVQFPARRVRLRLGADRACGYVRFCADRGVGPLAQADDHDLSAEQSRVVAGLVREELARRRISRQRLADDARSSISTLEKALAGRRPFTLATLIRLEQALSVSLRPKGLDQPGRGPGLAPEGLGAYARPGVAWLEGDYLTLRPSFEVAGAVYAYRTEISWGEETSTMLFREAERLDSAFVQHGEVSVSHQSGHIYLVTNEHGQYRLAVLGRPTIRGELYGLLTTLRAGAGGHLMPVAAPIALVPRRNLSDPVFGRITPDHPAHAAYAGHLERILGDGYARLYAEAPKP